MFYNKEKPSKKIIITITKRVITPLKITNEEINIYNLWIKKVYFDIDGNVIVYEKQI